MLSLNPPVTVECLNLYAKRTCELAVRYDAALGLNLSYADANQEQTKRNERLSPHFIDPIPHAFETNAFNDHNHPQCNSLQPYLRSYGVLESYSSSVIPQLQACTSHVYPAAAAAALN
jgi:hypothetical protein